MTIKVLSDDFTKIIYMQDKFISPVRVYVVVFFVQSFAYLTPQLITIFAIWNWQI